MKRSAFLISGVVAVIASACNSGGTPSAGTSGTAGPAPHVPAGVQFVSKGTLPATLNGGRSRPIVHGSTVVIAGSMSGATQPKIAVSADSGSTWQVVTPAGNQAAPAGFPLNRSGFSADAGAAGDPGFVLIGSASWWSYGYSSATREDFVWFSPDGHSWKYVNIRGISGAASLALHGVAWVGDEFVLTGETAGTDPSLSQSHGIVFTSKDGMTWTRAGAPPTRWSGEVHAAHRVGGKLVVTGVEYVCTADAGAFATFSVGAQPRVWSSADNGSTWTAVAVPDDIVGGAKPNPANAAACKAAGGGSLGGNSSTFTQDVAAIGVAGDSLIVWSTDHTKTASTTDLTKWTSLDVPGAKAVQKDTISLRKPTDVLISHDGVVPTLISLENRRDDKDQQTLIGQQTIVWRLDGGTWKRQPGGRPLLLRGTTFLTQVGDTVWTMDGVTNSIPAPIEIAASDAGDLKNFGSCTPAAHADCSFSKIDSTSALKGADLSGINVDGASLIKVDLSGTNLNGASARSAQLNGVNLSGANLKGARFDVAGLSSADMTGADVTGGNFDSALVSASFFKTKGYATAAVRGIILVPAAGDSLAGLNLAGLNLTGASFDSFRAVLSMTGADLHGADLTSVSFDGVDLTGANFSGATLTFINFGESTICPDGKKPSTGGYGAARCRL